MNNNRIRPRQFNWLLLLTLTLSACGFQPRGQAVAPATGLTPLAVVGIDRDTPMYIALQRRLGDALVTDPSQANAVLVIRAVRSQRELLTIDDRNKANEFELIESLVFRVRQHGKVSERQTLSVHRIHYGPGTDVLARSREEEGLRDVMRQELADQLMLRLSAWR